MSDIKAVFVQMRAYWDKASGKRPVPVRMYGLFRQRGILKTKSFRFGLQINVLFVLFIREDENSLFS